MHAYEKLGIPGEFGKNSELPIRIDATLTLKMKARFILSDLGSSLAQLAVEAGARIFEHSDVILMDLKKGYFPCKSGHEVQFNELVLMYTLSN